LGRDFTINRREFGIDRSYVQSVIFRCASCKKGCFSADDEFKLRQLSATDENTTQQFQSVAKVLGSPEQVLMGNQDDITQLEKGRFPSMVAHVPDKTCIWYDRKCKSFSFNGVQGVSYSQKFRVKRGFPNYLEVAISQFGSAKK
jgi:hypothetical protein